METRNYHFDYDMSMSTLEDIQLLSEFSLSPLIGRAYFHLSEIKRKADATSRGLDAHYEMVTKVLDEKFESIFIDFFGNTSKFKSYDFFKSTAKIDIKKWNLILEIIPEVLSVVSLFNFHGGIDIKIDENKLLFSAMILEEGHLEINRKFIYVVTRKLLRQKVLFTFKLEQTAKAGLLKLDLKVDISHDESLVYKVNFKINEKENYLVGFSNVFCLYRAKLEDLMAIGEHHIIEISNEATLKHTYAIPDLNPLELVNKEILHFSFLFHPVSIILPMRGNLSAGSFTRSVSSSHDDKQKREQNVSTYYRTIDFFSLFNI